MKSLVSGLIALMVALWVVAIAVLSIQNVFIMDESNSPTLVSLKFLGLSSISLPFGVILAISAAIGMISMALLLPIWMGKKPRFPSARSRQSRRRTR